MVNAKQRISEEKLAEFWRINPQTMIKWRNAGRIDSDVKDDAERGYHHYYYFSTVEAYHLAHSTGFGPDLPLPSFSELLRSEPALIIADEAAQRLGYTVDYLRASIRRGETPAFYLGKQSVRLPAALISLQASTRIGLQASVMEKVVDVETAARILCIKPSTVRLLLRTGHLKPIKLTLPGDYPRKYVERASLLELLSTLVSDFVPPEVWWEKTLQTEGESLSIDRLTVQYQVSQHTVANLIKKQSRSLPHIRTTGNKPQRVIPAWGVQTFLREERERLTPKELAAILGVNADLAERWIQTHTLCKRPHGQAWHRCPTRSCMREYITTHRTHAGLDADEWLTTTLQLGVAAVSIDELVATTPMLEARDIEEAFADGTFINGVRLPVHNGCVDWALPGSEAMGFRRRWERQMQ